MKCELVQTRTADAVRLDGALIPAEAAPPTGVAAALLLHGLAGNFYSSPLLAALAKTLSRAGIAALLANTRGHDVVHWLVRGGKNVLHGAAFETVADGARDVAGWTACLQQRGYSRILLVGHSLGAIKALYASSHEPADAIVGVAALSASRLEQQQLLAGPGGERLRQALAVAEDRCAHSAGQTLLHVDYLFPALVTAATYADKYGAANRYDWRTFIECIRVPVWMAFGQRELGSATFETAVADLHALRAAGRDVEPCVIPHADHFYSGCVERLAAALIEWIHRRFPNDPAATNPAPKPQPDA